jgi:hypothetical protein
MSNSRSDLVGRRAELLAELFFQELDPVFISKPTTSELGYDLLVGFSNDKAGINTFAVEVKSTERPPAARFPIERSVFDRLAHSNVPGLLLVVDVKRSQLYYAWLRSSETEIRNHAVFVELATINEATKEELKRQFQMANGGVAAAG